VPSGFVVESAFYEGDKAIVVVRASGSIGLCPSRGTVSRRVDSHYRRRVTDLPLSGRIVQLLVIARRFRCDAVLYGRQIFTERFAEGVLAPSARRTARLESIVRHLGLALGGRPAAGFAERLMLPVRTTRSCAWSVAAAVRRLTVSSSLALTIGMAAQSPVRQHRLQSGKAPDNHLTAGSCARDRPSLARCSSHDRNYRP
jgi:hypothetical protein